MTYYTHKTDAPNNIDILGFGIRRKGFEVRDAIVIPQPDNKSSVSLVTRAQQESTFVEGVIRGESDVLDIDGSRVESDYSDKELRSTSVEPSRGEVIDFKNGKNQDLVRHNSKGRFPTNLILKHGPSCKCEGTKKVKGGTAYYENLNKIAADNGAFSSGGWDAKDRSEKTSGYAGKDGKEEVADWDCEQGCPVREMDAQSGSAGSVVKFKQNSSNINRDKTKGGLFWSGEKSAPSSYGDSGGASRFFKQVQSEDELDDYLQGLVRG